METTVLVKGLDPSNKLIVQRESHAPDIGKHINEVIEEWKRHYPDVVFTEITFWIDR